MDLKPYVDDVRRELLVAAEAGGDEARALAERLIGPLESAIRLTLLNALSNAADEITRDLAPGSVDLRLRGLDPSFVVTARPAGQWEERPREAVAPVAPSVSPVDEEGVTARINFRPPEQLKTRIEEAANGEGLSVNAWLVRVVSGVLSGASRRAERRSPISSQSYTGWAR